MMACNRFRFSLLQLHISAANYFTIHHQQLSKMFMKNANYSILLVTTGYYIYLLPVIAKLHSILS